MTQLVEQRLADEMDGKQRLVDEMQDKQRPADESHDKQQPTSETHKETCSRGGEAIGEWESGEGCKTFSWSRYDSDIGAVRVKSTLDISETKPALQAAGGRPTGGMTARATTMPAREGADSANGTAYRAALAARLAAEHAADKAAEARYVKDKAGLLLMERGLFRRWSEVYAWCGRVEPVGAVLYVVDVRNGQKLRRTGRTVSLRAAEINSGGKRAGAERAVFTVRSKTAGALKFACSEEERQKWLLEMKRAKATEWGDEQSEPVATKFRNLRQWW